MADNGRYFGKRINLSNFKWPPCIVNQEKLNNAKVAIAGLGGLGSNIAVALARIGVGHLHLIDFDKVDISNLNRQHYFISHLNEYKNASSSRAITNDKSLFKISLLIV